MARALGLICGTLIKKDLPMTRFRVLYLFIPVLFSACTNPECAKMSMEIDSLKKEINSGGQMVDAVVSVNSLLDSIDATRHTLRVHQATGQEAHRYDERML